MAKNDVKVTDNPKLKQKRLSDGTISLYLDYYLGRFDVKDEKTGEIRSKIQRKREFLSLYLCSNARTPFERQKNKETIEYANQIRYEREQKFLEDKEGYINRNKLKDVNFLVYFQNYIDHYTKKDKRNVQLALNRFKKFLKVTPEYQRFEKNLRPSQISKDMILSFSEKLQEDCKGEGAKTIFARFKKVIKYAYDHQIFSKNPTDGISIKVDDNILRKEILSQDEMKTLMATHYKNESPLIRRAVAFSLKTGIRYTDLVKLTFRSIDYGNRKIFFVQNKTRKSGSSSGVVIPLNDGLLKLIGQPQKSKDEVIFPLPSLTMCNKALKRWCAHAHINKRISWGSFRHSFATALVYNSVGISTVAQLLGHSSLLRYTEKYIRAVDSLKQEAINSLPELDF